MDLLGLLMGSLGAGSSVDALSQKTGLSVEKLSKLMMTAIPMLLKFLTKNASSAIGAQSLLGALAGHQETRSMADQINGADEEDGAKIISHILGDQSERVMETLAKDTDLENADVSKALSNIAPALMSGLSAATTSASKVNLSDGLDLSDLMGMFGGAAPSASASQGGGLLGGLLGGSGGGIGGLLGGSGGGIGGLLGGLFGGGNEKEEKDDDFDANALLGTLTSLMK